MSLLDKKLSKRLACKNEESVKNLEEQEELQEKIGSEESLEALNELRKKEKELIERYEELKANKKKKLHKEYEEERWNTSLFELNNKDQTSRRYEDVCRSLENLICYFEMFHFRSIRWELWRTALDIENGRELRNVPKLKSFVNGLQELGAQLQQFVPDKSEPTHANVRVVALEIVDELSRLFNEINSRIKLYQAGYDPNSNDNAARLQCHSIKEHEERVKTLLDELDSVSRKLRERSELDEQLTNIEEEIEKNRKEQEKLKKKFGNEESLEAREELKKMEDEMSELYKQLGDPREEEWNKIPIVKTMKDMSLKSYEDICRSLSDCYSSFERQFSCNAYDFWRNIDNIDKGRQLVSITRNQNPVEGKVQGLTKFVDNDVQEFGARLIQFVPDERKPKHAVFRTNALNTLIELNRLFKEIISRMKRYEAEYDPHSDDNPFPLEHYSIKVHASKVNTVLNDLNLAFGELMSDNRKTYAETSQKTAGEGDPSSSSQPSEDDHDHDQPGPSSAK